MRFSSFFFLINLFLAIGTVVGTPTSCYTGSDNTVFTTASQGYTLDSTTMGSNFVCIRYCFCGNTSCSASQISASVGRAAYSIASADTAAVMAAYSRELLAHTYWNVFACSTSNCNSPLTNLCSTPPTFVRKICPVSSSAVSCYVGVLGPPVAVRR